MVGICALESQTDFVFAVKGLKYTFIFKAGY